MLEELIKVGDKTVFYRNSYKNNKRFDETKRLCIGQIEKILSDSELVISNDNDIRDIFCENECYIADIYSSNKVYRCSVYYISNYTEGDRYYFTIEPVSPLQKVQRRRHQRYSCHMFFSYYVLQDEQVHDIIEKGWESFNVEMDNTKPELVQNSLVDISGGGLRFTSDRGFNIGDYLFCLLKIDDTGSGFPVIGEVVYSDRFVNDNDKFDVRIKYIGITEGQRRDVVEFVFWLERQKLK